MKLAGARSTGVSSGMSRLSGTVEKTAGDNGADGESETDCSGGRGSKFHPDIGSRSGLTGGDTPSTAGPCLGLRRVVTLRSWPEL